LDRPPVRSKGSCEHWWTIRTSYQRHPAALAGSGQGRDDPPRDEAARTRLRRQALTWLKTGLAIWEKPLKTGPSQAKALIARTLEHWKQDTDLEGVRDSGALESLPEFERTAWDDVWAKVAALLATARGPS
jgi:hypothetical protein